MLNSSPYRWLCLSEDACHPAAGTKTVSASTVNQWRLVVWQISRIYLYGRRDRETYDSTANQLIEV
jgi:hypothetical protein